MIERIKKRLESLTPIGELGLALILGPLTAILICSVIAAISISLGAN